MDHATPGQPPAVEEKPSLPIVELLILLALIVGALTVRIDLSGLAGTANQAPAENPARRPAPIVHAETMS